MESLDLPVKVRGKADDGTFYDCFDNSNLETLVSYCEGNTGAYGRPISILFGKKDQYWDVDIYALGSYLQHKLDAPRIYNVQQDPSRCKLLENALALLKGNGGEEALEHIDDFLDVSIKIHSLRKELKDAEKAPRQR